MALYTFWLPIVDFNSLKNSDIKKEIIDEYSITTLIFQRKFYKLFLDSTGFYYIEISDENIKNKDAIYQDINEHFINKKSIELLYDSFLNKNLICKEDIVTIENFIQHIIVKIDNLNDINLVYVTYNTIHEKDKRYCKFESKNNSQDYDFYNIINRNFEQLIKKSLFYTAGLKYEKNEVYDLEVFRSANIKNLINSCIFNVEKNNEKIIYSKAIIENIIKKAIQDSIEEYTLLKFLKNAKSCCIDKIYKQITDANSKIKKMRSQILAIDSDIQNSKDKCSISNEEEIEIFVENLLQAIPKLKALDNKLKSAYYIKVGNMTTQTNVADNETIEHTSFYISWKSSIDYFEHMSYSLKEILVIYHQNRNIKELEELSYYENYKSDLDDIKNLNFSDGESGLLNKEEKSYIEILVAIIALTALAGEAPIINPNYIKEFQNLHLSIIDMNTVYVGAKLLWITFLNLFLYTIIFFPLLYIAKILKFKNIFIYLFNNQKKDKRYLYFDQHDYDKHEHRSFKPIITYKNNKKSNLTVSYNENYSAYHLMEKLKDKKLKKSSGDSYDLFPTILKDTYNKDNLPFHMRENYRVSRSDKVTTKILLRYKITDLLLSDLLHYVHKDSFRTYYNEVTNQVMSDINNKDNMEIENLDNIIKKLCRIVKYRCNEKFDINIENRHSWYRLKIKLNLYIVYSFNLKLEKSKKAKYTYKVVKDQYRVHYHINNLPKEDANNNLHYIAELIYIYFLARLKRLDYVFENNKNEDKEKVV